MVVECDRIRSNVLTQTYSAVSFYVCLLQRTAVQIVREEVETAKRKLAVEADAEREKANGMDAMLMLDRALALCLCGSMVRLIESLLCVYVAVWCA